MTSQARLVSAMKVWFYEVYACSLGRPRERIFLKIDDFDDPYCILGHQGGPRPYLLKNLWFFMVFEPPPWAPLGPLWAPLGTPWSPKGPHWLPTGISSRRNAYCLENGRFISTRGSYFSHGPPRDLQGPPKGRNSKGPPVDKTQKQHKTNKQQAKTKTPKGHSRTILARRNARSD